MLQCCGHCIGVTVGKDGAHALCLPGGSSARSCSEFQLQANTELPSELQLSAFCCLAGAFHLSK